MWHGLKIRTQISLGYVLPIATIFLAAGFGVVTGQGVISTFKEIHRVEQVLDSSRELERGMQLMLRSGRAYFLTQSPSFLQKFQEGKSQYNEGVKSLQQEGLIHDADQKQRLNAISDLVDSYYLKKMDSILAIAEQGDLKLATSQFLDFVKTNNLDARFTEAILTFEKKEKEILNLREAHAEDAINRLNTVFLVGGFGLGIFAMIIAIVISQRIGQMILETVDAIATSANEITTTTEQQERSASQQAASVHETTTTMDELGASSQQSAQQAEAASSAVQIALEQSHKGNQAVQLTLEEMTELRHKVDNIAQEITQLTSQTQRIGSISQLVSDIANQTNMLALNAAVEAVRAGEHGKGFSVVANEIRKLADQSKRSAGEISHLASEIETSITSTIRATEEGTRSVDSGMDITRRTTQAFADVSGAVNEVVTNNQQILLNIRQQAAAIQQVLQAMTNINQGSQETALGIGQIRSATEKLNEAASVMQNLI